MTRKLLILNTLTQQRSFLVLFPCLILALSCDSISSFSSAFIVQPTNGRRRKINSSHVAFSVNTCLFVLKEQVSDQRQTTCIPTIIMPPRIPPRDDDIDEDTESTTFQDQDNLREQKRPLPTTGIIFVDPFSKYHSEYLMGRSLLDYNVGVVKVLSPYIAVGLNKEYNDDVDGESIDHITLTAPLENEDISTWLEQIPFSIRAIICESDGGLDYAERLSEVISQYYYSKKDFSSYDNFKHNGYNGARRDKYLMNEVCKSNGVAVVKQALCSSVDDASLRAKELFSDTHKEDDGEGGKFIIKPHRGVASDRVNLCSVYDDEEKFINCIKGSCSDILNSIVYGSHEELHENILLNEYVPGVEYAIDTVSKNGKHKTAALWVYDKVSTNADKTTNPFAYTCTRLVNTTDITASNEHHPSVSFFDIIQYVEACLDALDIKWGMVHTEVKVTPSGKIRLIETNIRQQNDNFGDLCTTCIGYNALDLCLSAYLDDCHDIVASSNGSENPFDDIPKYPTLSCNGMIVNLVCYVDGTISGINHVDFITNELPSVVNVMIYPNFSVGSKATITKDLRSDCGWIHLIHDDYQTMMNDYNVICDLMHTMFDVE